MGPTNLNPRLCRNFESATPSSVLVAWSASALDRVRSLGACFWNGGQSRMVVSFV